MAGAAPRLPSDSPYIPTGVPVGAEAIPELNGREPTHNEQALIAGEPIAVGSSNVDEFWWSWQNRRLFVRFLDGSLYAYEGVPLPIAVGMIETDSHGRYVWNVLRANGYPYRKLDGGGKKKATRVIRIHGKGG